MKNWPKLKLNQVGVGSNIAKYHSSSLYEVISGHYVPKSPWIVKKHKLDQVEVGLNIAQNCWFR